MGKRNMVANERGGAGTEIGPYNIVSVVIRAILVWPIWVIQPKIAPIQGGWSSIL